MTTSVVIVDDHNLVREGLRTVLGQHDDILVVGEAASVDDALAVVHRAVPDLVLLDLRLAEENGIEVARRLRDEQLAVKVLVLSAHDSPQHLREALAAGADGYLLKSATGTALADGIRRAMAGETVIGEEFVPKLLHASARGEQSEAPTARELEVLALVADGLPTRDVADELGLSPRTVQKHLEHLFRKLGARDRAELVSVAFRRGLLD